MSLSLLIVAIVAAIGFFQLGSLTVWTMVLAIALRTAIGLIVIAVVSGLSYWAWVTWRRYRSPKPSRKPERPEANDSESEDSGENDSEPSIIMP